MLQMRQVTSKPMPHVARQPLDQPQFGIQVAMQRNTEEQ